MVFDCELFGDYPRCSGFEWAITLSGSGQVKFSDAPQAWPLQVLARPMLLGRWQACELGRLASDLLHSVGAAMRCFEGLLETSQVPLPTRRRLSAKVGRTL